MEYSYNPSRNLLSAVRSLFPLEICPWDDYYPRMAQTDWLDGRAELLCSKTYFYRKAPFGGSYCILGGLTAFLRTLEDFQFNDTVTEALLEQGYRKKFTKFLSANRQVNVTVHAVPEGSVLFPNEPGIILTGPLWAVRLAEGMMLKQVNFPSLSMTKWNRVVQAASPGMTMEFARRRSQDDLRTTLYAYLAGIDVSSNSEIRRGADIRIVGTMGHEFIQSIGDEFKAFDIWLEHNPERPVLLVDTVDTLKSGLPNAIRAFKKHIERIRNAGSTPGIRNDSGDLAYITLEERAALDAAGLPDTIIYQTNELDEYSIESMRQQIFTHASRAGLDTKNTLSQIVWACGTRPGVCQDQPSLGGVAKLTSVETIKGGEKIEVPVIKLARDNPIKTSIPGNNRSCWVINKDNNQLICCLIHRLEEKQEDITAAYHPDDESKIIPFYGTDQKKLPRQKMVYNPVLKTRILEVPFLDDVRNTLNKDLALLHWTHKRLQSPHSVKVSLSKELFELRRDMIKYQKIMAV